jgi:Mg2+ and Co2+ transporter CorA
MVVSQAEFQKALREINDSYAKMVERIDELEKLVKESKPTTTRKSAA